mmetsp:Transcript_23407/g.32554  ORF Transcript_23407/g.32554 Transcript_23407/m.32554 type:complete len:227 (-) Transcript_23407:282-962(-)
MLIASCLRPSSASITMIVCTHSYKMAFPGFFEGSVLMEICARISVISSLAFELPVPKMRSSPMILHWRKGSVIPTTSYSEIYPASSKVLRCRTRDGTRDRNLLAYFFFSLQISVMSAIAVMSTLCCFVFKSAVAGLMKSTTISGTFFTIRIAVRAAFFLMYGFPLPNKRITSFERSRAMSAEDILPMEQSAKPTIYGFLCFKSPLRQFVTSISTSWVSSSKSIRAR